MAVYFRILVWRIPWTEESGKLQSMGLQRVRHDRITNTFTFASMKSYNLQNDVPYTANSIKHIRVLFRGSVRLKLFLSILRCDLPFIFFILFQVHNKGHIMNPQLFGEAIRIYSFFLDYIFIQNQNFFIHFHQTIYFITMNTKLIWDFNISY